MRKKADREPRESSLVSGWTVEAEPSVVPLRDSYAAQVVPGGGAGDPLRDETGGTGESPGEGSAPPVQLSNGALVLLGVVGGLYLLYTWVWFSWANYYSQMNSAVAEGSGAIGAVLQQAVFWAAPFAPALWFIAAYLLCRASRTWNLALWLLIGAVVLLPLPALVTVGGS
ncbi:hypothetical protein [Leucobacter sp. W1038]|uniref:hypothetical protein n=1 Tax=Leucobacter sp. W1038 TaxID=3438281 RepID=UPI003D9537AF